MKQIFILLFLFISRTGLSENEPDWVQFYDGQGNITAQDFGYSLVTDNMNNVIISGTSQTASSDKDFITIKYTATGDLLWQKKYSDQANYSEECLINNIDIRDNIYAGGITIPPGSGWDYTVIKYDQNGVTKWDYKHHYNTTNGGHFGNIQTDENFNVYFTVSIPYQGTDILKLDSNGSLLWRKSIHGSGFWNSLCALDKTSGSIVVLNSHSLTKGIVKITKISSSGDSLWSRVVNNYTTASDIFIDSGDIYFTCLGNTESSFVVKYSASGELIWQKEFVNGTSKKLLFSPAGYIYVGGIVLKNPGSDFLILKYSNAGNLIWYKTFSFNNDDNGLEDLCLDSNDNIYASGVSNGGCASVKFNKDGNYLWSNVYKIKSKETSYGFSNGIRNNNFYVTGYGIGNGTGCDIITLKYNSVLGINQTSTETPQYFSLSQNYPNPFNPTTNFEFSIPLSRGVSEGRGVFVNLTIYDAMGRAVETLQNGEMKPGVYKAEWNASGYPSGVYFYRLNAEGFTETNKMVLVK